MSPKERDTASGVAWKSYIKLFLSGFALKNGGLYLFPVMLLLGLALRAGLMQVLFGEVTLMNLES